MEMKEKQILTAIIKLDRRTNQSGCQRDEIAGAGSRSGHLLQGSRNNGQLDSEQRQLHQNTSSSTSYGRVIGR